jgi:hypothetical protein
MDSRRTSGTVIENSRKDTGRAAKLPRLLIEDWLPAAAIGVECVRVALPTSRAASRATPIDHAEELRAVKQFPLV